MGLALPDDVPVDTLNIRHDMDWPRRWQEMISYLEAQAPCIYIPNYDYDYSCISPCLSDKVKVVTVAHSDDPANYEHVMRLRDASDAVIGVSTAILKQLLAYDPGLAERLHHIPYGVDIPVLGPRTLAPADPLRMIYTGRLADYEKRTEDLRPLTRSLEQRGIPFELTVVGEGDQRHHLQYLRPISLYRRVWTTGLLPHEEVLKILGQQHVFLSTSSFAGMPVSLLEAMAHGLVPVVSDIRSGIPQLISDGVNGFRVPVGDIDAYVDRLALLYEDPGQRERMSRSAHTTISEQGYGIETVVDRYLELFEHLIVQKCVRRKGAILPPKHLSSQNDWEYRLAHAIKSPYRRVKRLGQFLGEVLN